MKQTLLAVLVLGAVLVMTPTVWAEAPTGFGIGAGLGSGDYDDGTFSETFSGPAIVLDFQFALGDLISIGPKFQYYRHEGEIDFGPFGTFDITATTTAIGAEARVWLGGVYAGGSISRYNTEFEVDGNTDGQGGNGFGAVVGWEADGGFWVQGQVDSFTLDSDPEMDVTAMHVLAGFRFK